MFLFSLVRVDKTPTGALCFNPKNPYWRFMKRIYPKLWGNKMSLCRTHWMTELVVVGATLISILLFIGWQAGLWFTLKVLGVLILCVGILLLFLVGVFAILIGLEKIFNFTGWTEWYHRHKNVCDAIAVSGIVLAVLAGMTVAEAYDLGVDFVMALLVVLKYTVFGIWICAAVVGAMLGVIYVVMLLIDFVMSSKQFAQVTAFGQVVVSAKESLCPTLYECEEK